MTGWIFSFNSSLLILFIKILTYLEQNRQKCPKLDITKKRTIHISRALHKIIKSEDFIYPHFFYLSYGKNNRRSRRSMGDSILK